MSYGISDEVAEDFKLALEDLTMNSRYEISNLTVIAKENTEHALAISEALKDHIKRVGNISYYRARSLRIILFAQLKCRLFFYIFCSFTYIDSDGSGEETPCALSPRFYC